MRLGKSVPESTVVASWLKAEVDSHRFSRQISKALHRTSINESIVRQPDLDDTDQNKLRERLLRLARGRAFKRLPWHDISWYDLFIENREELGKLYTPFGDTWLAFTNGERLLSKASAFISTLPASHDPQKHVLGIKQQLDNNSVLEPPILVTPDAQFSRPLNILEGNVRLVAYYGYDKMPYPIRAYVGIAPRIASWAHSTDTLEDIRNAFRQQGRNTL